jgi:hypothetical protein
MNYYDPYLAFWVLGGRAFAAESEKAVLMLNDTLEQIYRAAGSPVADVEGAFSTTDFTTEVYSKDFGITIPLNVTRICQWTWMCNPKNVNSSFGLEVYVHPNTAGYSVIRDAFYQVLPHPVRD